MPSSIATIVASLRQSTGTSPRKLAVAIHNHVRDDIRFGFTRRHDMADAQYTVDRQIGHCTPKANLFCSLLREAGFADATMVTVPIPGNVLQFLGENESSPYPNRLQHTFTEVTIEGRFCRLDSYVIDRPLFAAAQAKLQAVNHPMGYGIHSQGTMEWDGRSDVFSQYVEQTPDLEKRGATSNDIVAMPDYEHRGLLSLLSIPLMGYYTAGNWLERQQVPLDALRQEGRQCGGNSSVIE